MQEIAPKVYIETGYPGVTLGAVNRSYGLILIDAPIRQEDARSWRGALLTMGGGIERMLVILDGHYDRTVGVRNMDCTVVGQSRLLDIYRSRPVTFKAQGTETGAEWEQQSNLGSIRWASPEITFNDELTVHWDDLPILLEHRPGPSSAAIWLELVQEKVLFLGDFVVPGQPPFLASADIPVWIDQLKILLGKEYRNHLMVSGRGGLIAHDEVHRQVKFLEKANQQLEKLAARKARLDEVEALAGPLSASFDSPADVKDLFQQRLRYGLNQYYNRRFFPDEPAGPEE